MAARSEKYGGWIAFDLHRKDGAVVECLISDQTMVNMFGAVSRDSAHVIAAFDSDRAGIEAYAESTIAEANSDSTRVVLDD